MTEVVKRRLGAPPKKKNEGLFDEKLTMEQAAQLFAVSRVTIVNLVNKGLLAKTKDGYVTLVELARAYVRDLKDELKNRSRSTALMKVQESRADEINMRIALKTGASVPYKLVLDDAVTDYGELKASLSGMGAAVTRDLEMRKKIDDYADECLERFRLSVEKKMRTLGADPQDYEDVEASDAGSLGGGEPDLPGDRRRSGKKKPAADPVRRGVGKGGRKRPLPKGDPGHVGPVG